jgi:hypothetical protein
VVNATIKLCQGKKKDEPRQYIGPYRPDVRDKQPTPKWAVSRKELKFINRTVFSKKVLPFLNILILYNSIDETH